MLMTYTLCFAGQPLAQSKTWQDVADFALSHGLAVRVFNCIFTLLPGASIEQK